MTKGPPISLPRWRNFVAPGVIIALILVVLMLFWPFGGDSAESRMLQEGALAPNFSLPGKDGQEVLLADLLAENQVLLYFSMGYG